MDIDDKIRFIEACRKHPEVFFEKVLGVKTVWKKQLEISHSVRDHRWSTCKSCHASGKTYISACIAEWFLQCFPNSIVITTAPTWKQVEKVLWGEIRTLHGSAVIPLQGEVLNTQIKIADKWYALGLSTDEGNNLQGFHSDHVLIIIDEATGVTDEMHESVKGLMTDERCRLLMIGNPTSTDGEFYRSFASPLYNKITISAFDTPNLKAGKMVIPGLVSKVWVDEVRAESGEESPIWVSRVLGEFPDEADDVLIPLRWVERAEATDIRLQGYEPKILGIDVARMGSNDTVFMPRIGNMVTLINGRIPHHQGKDTVVTLGRAIQIIESFQPDAVVIDDDGVGGTIYDHLCRKYSNIYRFTNNTVKNVDTVRFLNQKSEVYFSLSDKFRNGLMSIPKNTKLTMQLPTIRYTIEDSAGGVVQKILSKRKTKKTGFESPDFADALMLTEYGMMQIGYRFEPSQTGRLVYNNLSTGLSMRPRKTKSRTGY